MVLTIVNAATDSLTTAEVARRMTPKPSRDTVLRALTTHAESGQILRDPPIGEAATRRTVTWRGKTVEQGNLPQDPHTHMGEISAADDIAAVTASSDTQIGRPIDILQETRCPVCGCIGWLKPAPGGYLCKPCGTLHPLHLVTP